MNLLLWTGELNDGLIPVLKLLKNLGYDGVELPVFNTSLDYAKWGKIQNSFLLRIDIRNFIYFCKNSYSMTKTNTYNYE